MSKDTSAAAIEELKQKDAATVNQHVAANPDIETVEFDSPIIRNNLTITEVNINKPKTGALRGLALSSSPLR